MPSPWVFDIRSALLVGALLTLLISGLLAVVSRAMPAAFRPAVAWWVAATLLQPAGFVLLSLRGEAPPLLTIVVANGLVALAFAAYAMALRRFFKREAAASRGLAAAVLLVIASSAWWGLVRPAMPPRLITVSLVLAWMLGYCAWTLYRHSDARGPIRHVAGGVFLVSAAIMAYRAMVPAFAPEQVTTVFQLTHVQLLTYAVGSILPVVATVGFLLMCAERSQRELERAARVDYLTGCYNRRAIEEMGTRAIAAARRHGMPMAALVADIDHFKRINDELGHAIGDQALVRTVERIRDGLRTEDVLGRLGGEEFIVLMPNTDGDSAVAAGERIRAAFSELPLLLDGHLRTVTLSVGVAVLAPADRLFSQLLQRADRTMYAAKNAGRDLVISDSASGWGGRGGSG